MFASCDESRQKCKDILSDINCESSVDNGNNQLEGNLMLKEKGAYKHDEDSSEDSSNYSQANNENITTELEFPLNNCTIENADEESENIYEEVYTSAHTFLNHSTETSLKSAHVGNSKALYNRKSLVDEVMYEVEKVQRQHVQVLKELNLEVENMIMPAPSPATLSPTSSVAQFTQDNESNDFIYTTSCKNPGVHSSFQDQCKMVSKQNAPPLPERITSSSSRFFPTDNLVNIEEGIMTSTPVSKCKWAKTATWIQPKGINEIQDTSFSDESIYEDIDQHICDETKVDNGYKKNENEKDQNSCRFVTNNITEKSVPSLGFSVIRHKLRTVRQRMSKLKEGIKENNNTNVSFQETGRISQFDGNSLISKIPQDIKFHLHPPNLPPPPKGLSSDQIKRRCIISTLVHSENTYFSTLKRLLHDYKKPLEESHPPILNKAKIDTLFFRIPEIQQCHAMFRIALAECVKHWDKEEKIGEVFVASFSKSMVFEIYSDFINNFSIAMELAKTESKRKAAFSDFLKVKQVTSHDRLSFFGLMVKPVQRFPQFIMLLQDLLKLTPSHQCDRLNLQLALTQLESLAERLNERKRESEQQHAVQELFRHINVKFALKPLSDCSNFLIREDNVLLLKFDQENQLVKTKERKLFLLNNLLICVAVSIAPSPVRNLAEKYTLKWAVPVSEVEIQEDISPLLNRMIISSGWGKHITPKGDANNIHILSQEISNLMNDFEVISRISSLITTLKKTYEGLTLDLMQSHLNSIIQIIQTKDEEMKWIDDCCLQLLLPIKSKNVKELVIFQTSGPKAHKEWVFEFHLAQLALNRNNNPAWDIMEQEPIPSTKMPLFSCYFPVYQASYPTEVKSACYCFT